MPVQLQAFQTDHPTNPLHKVVTDSWTFEEMVRRMSAAQALTFDFETSGTAWFQHARASGIALSTWDEACRIHSYYVPFRHDTGEAQLDYGVVAPPIKQILETPTITKLAHNLKFDAHMARREGWGVCGPRYDTMIAARLYDENKLISLKKRVQSDLGHYEVDDTWEKPLKKEVYRRAKLNKMKITDYQNRYGYSQLPIHLVGTYACWDAHYTTELFWFYERWGLSGRYTRIWPTEMALTEVLGDMEWEGLPINVEYLENLQDALGGVKHALRDRIWEAAGRQFNIHSEDDLRQYLMSIGVPLEQLTKAGQKEQMETGKRSSKYSVEKEVLEGFKGRHPTIPLILEWREADKLETTYTQSLLDLMDDNQVLHPDFQQVGADTGRLSCRKPNFQNQPTDDDDRAIKYSGKKLEDGGIDPWSIRRAFIVRDPKIPRLFFDYSQVELRVLAHYSKDPIMTDAFLKGEDIHSRTSLEVFGTDEKAWRRKAKIINFGLSYCMSEWGFARQTKVPVDDAKKYLDKFFERYSGIARFREDLWNHVFSHNCEMNNLFGRTRRLPDLGSEEEWRNRRAQRQAIGSLIQGTAAELTKESLVRVYRFLKAEHPEAKLVNTVHDEIQIDCPVDCLTPVVQGVKRLMEDFPEFAPIPIIVDGDYSITNWAEKKSLPC